MPPTVFEGENTGEGSLEILKSLSFKPTENSHPGLSCKSRQEGKKIEEKREGNL
jgi:hypothetical protein